MPITKELIEDMFTEVTDKGISLSICSLISFGGDIEIELSENGGKLPTKSKIESIAGRFSQSENYYFKVHSIGDGITYVSFYHKVGEKMRCIGLTKGGNRCSRMTDSEYCFQHKK